MYICARLPVFQALLFENKPNEEPAKLNRDVALRAVRPNSLFYNVVFS
jgi:hypothetical protein